MGTQLGHFAVHANQRRRHPCAATTGRRQITLNEANVLRSARVGGRWTRFTELLDHHDTHERTNHAQHRRESARSTHVITSVDGTIDIDRQLAGQHQQRRGKFRSTAGNNRNSMSPLDRLPPQQPADQKLTAGNS